MVKKFQHELSVFATSLHILPRPLEGSGFDFLVLFIFCAYNHVNKMTLDAPKINVTFEGKFETIN